MSLDIVVPIFQPAPNEYSKDMLDRVLSDLYKTLLLYRDALPAAGSGSGGGVTDGDKGDIIVSSAGASWTIDPIYTAAVRDRALQTGTALSTTISDFNEAAQDTVASMLVAGTNITLTYNDAANTLTISAAAGGGSSNSIASIPALRAELFSTGVPAEVSLRTSYVANDGGGVFVWDVLSTASDNGGTIIKITSIATGRFFRKLEDGTVRGEMFGLVSGTDCTVALTAFWNSAISRPGIWHILPIGTFNTTAPMPIIQTQNVWIEGQGAELHEVGQLFTGTCLRYTGATAAGSVLVEASAVSGAGNQRLTNVIVRGVGLDGNSGAIGRLFRGRSLWACDFNLGFANGSVEAVELGVVTSLGEAADTQRCTFRFAFRQIETPNARWMTCTGNATANVSLNEFWCDGIHMNVEAIRLLNSDNNDWRFIRTLCLGSAAHSVELHGGATTAELCRAERFHWVSSNKPVRAFGSPTYTVPTTGNTLFALDRENGTPFPIIDRNAQFTWRMDGQPLTDGATDVRTFGAKGDGITNDSAAFTAAFLTKEVYIPAGTFVVNPGAIVGISNQRVRGAGRGVTIIKASSNSASSMVAYVGRTSFHWSDLTIDWDNRVESANSGVIGLVTSNDWTFERVDIANFDRFGFGINACKRFAVKDFYIRRAAKAATQNQAILTSNFSGQTEDGEISGGICENSGINYEGRNLKIVHNSIKGFSFGAGITGEQNLTGNRNNFIGYNLATDGTGVDVNVYRCGGMEIWDYYSTVIGNICFMNDGAGMEMGGYRNIVKGNIFYDNGRGSTLFAGISARYGTATYNGSYCVVEGNQSFNTNGASGSQANGYAEESSLLVGISVANNNFTGNRTAPMSVLSGSTIVTVPSLQGSASWNPAPMANGTGETADVFVIGARLGDMVQASFSADLQGLTISGWVNTSNSVKVRISNNTGATVDLGAGTVRALLNKPSNYTEFQ